MPSTSRRAALVTALLTLAIALAASVRPASHAAAQELATPTPGTHMLPDRCEPNNTPDLACPLALDSVNGPYTLLPVGDRDTYAIDLGAEPTGLALAIAIRSTPGLDLRVSVRRAGEAEPLAILSSPTLTTTLDPGITGWLTLRVENRSPAPPEGQAYTIELRRVLPPPAPRDDQAAASEPDALEDNWSVATAAPIAVGVAYDLTFACPVAWGCVGGDHDYLAVPVKAGVAYRVATFDLGPGVDTVLDLFWGDAPTPAASSDDAFPATSFVSALTWRAPADGTLIVRVAPRAGATTPVVLDRGGGSYRLLVALAASEAGHALDTRLHEQSGIPPTPAAAVSGSAPLATPAAQSDAPTGPAVVSAQSTALREAPDREAQEITTLPQEALVTLLGQASGSWVRVQPDGGVLPGWVYGPDLRSLAQPETTATNPKATATNSALPVAPGASVVPTPLALPTATPLLPTVRLLDPLTPPAPVAPARAPLSVRVRIVVTGEQPAPARRPTPSPETERGLVGMRVQLVSALGDVLAEAITQEGGATTLTRDLPIDAAVLVRVPALGMQLAVDRATPDLTIRIPEGATR